MSFELTAKQALAYMYLTDDKTTEIGFGGGAGGGKSYLGCFWIIKQALEYPGTAWLIGRKELTNLKKTTLISFFKVLTDLKIKSKDIFQLNSQTNIMNFHNGSVVFLMDMSKQPSDPLYTRFGGLELTGAFVDESNENEEKALEIIKTRIGRGNNKKYNLTPKILETFNPSKDHVYKRYYIPWRDNKLPEHRTFIKSLVTDNKYQPEAYIEQLKKADIITRERLLYGNFEYDDDPTKLFNYDSIIDLFTNGAERGKRYAICDIAGFGRDKTVIGIWDGLFLEKVIIKNNITDEELDKLLVKEKVPRSQCLIDESGVGFGAVNNIKGVKGFVANARPFMEKKETDTEKVQHNYKNLKAQCWFELANYVNSGMIGITRSISIEAKNLLIEDLEQIKQKDPGKDAPMAVLTKDDIKEVLGRSTDVGDMLMMRMYFILKKPMAFGFVGKKQEPKVSEEKEDEQKAREKLTEELIKSGQISFGTGAKGRKEIQAISDKKEKK